MKISRKFIFVIAIVMIMSLSMPLEILADTSTRNVTVKIPNFKVRLNGETMDNTYSQYPLIVYKDITYFPMTYHNCRFLGLETKWAPQKPLEIEKKNISAAYYFYGQNTKNKTTYTASISNDFVSINGRDIDQDDVSKYPLLKFRNVRYFPLTWKYAVDNFGWKYEYTPEKGLIIESDNKRVNSIAKIDKFDDSFADVVYHDGYVYYRNKKGDFIMRAPVNNLKQAVKIFKMPINHYTDRPENPTLEVKDDGKVHMMFRVGGGVMGHDCEYYFDNNGKPVDISDELLLDKFNDITLIMNTRFPPGPNNLAIKGKDDKDFRKIGNQDYIWGTKRTRENPTGLQSNVRSITLYGDWVYVTGNLYNGADPGEEPTTEMLTGIYRVNTKTNEMAMLLPETTEFVREGDFIYALNDKGAYKISLSDGNVSTRVELNSTKHTGSYAVLNDKFYSSQTLKKSPVNFKHFSSGEKKYLACSFFKLQDNDLSDDNQGMTVFDADGNEVFNTDEKVAIKNVTLENGNLYYYSDTARCLCKVKL